MNLTVGYIKGSAHGRLLLEVDYNPEGKKCALGATEIYLALYAPHINIVS